MRQTEPFRILLSLLAALLLFGGLHGPAQAADLPSPKRVLAAADPLVAASAAELTAIHQDELAAAWHKAAPGKALLVWGYAESVGSLLPAYWLVTVVKNKQVIGLLALESRNQTFEWRATRLSNAQSKLVARLFKQSPQQLPDWARQQAGKKDPALYDFDRTVIASVNGSFYVVTPARGERLVASLAFPLSGGGKARELWQAVAQGRGVAPARLLPPHSGQPFSLEPPPGEQVVLAGEADMFQKVPLHARAGSASSWAYALGMVRQWWSPVSLGSREELAALFYHYSGQEGGDGVPLVAIYEMTRNGPVVDALWDRKKGDNGFLFEEFKKIWYGPGEPLSKNPDTNTWLSNDLRAWVHWESPVVVTVDADGMGRNEVADQVLLVTGFSTEHARVYANNPFGFADTFSYQAFDERYWAAWYNVQCDQPTICAAPVRYRRGMVAGTPGDHRGPPTPRPVASVPAAATDGGGVTIGNVGILLGPPEVPAFAGKDGFGESYRTSCTLLFPKADFKGDVQKGDWDDMREGGTKEQVRVTASLDSYLYPGSAAGGGSYKLSFSDVPLGDTVDITASCQVHDADDRAHFLDAATVEVYDDRVKEAGRFAMPKPLRRFLVASTEYLLVVRDDDPTPPNIDALSPDILFDNQTGAYRFKARIHDASGLADARVGWSFDGKKPAKLGSFDDHKGDLYWVDVDRKEWLKHVGGTMTFFVEAKDADKDRDNDQQLTVQAFPVSVADDDPVGPTVVQYVARRAENMQFQILVKLEDTSGVYVDASWPKLYYSFKETVNAETFDGMTKMVAAPQYGKGWFTAVAPWGEQGALAYAAQEKKKEDTFIHFKVRSYDLDKDRKGDDSESWSQEFSEVYLPAPLADSKTIVDIWPAGDREAGVNTLWDDWFDPPPKIVPGNLFFEGRPKEVSPPPVPEVLTGPNAKIRIHIAVSLAFVNSGANLHITGGSLSLAPYKLEAAIVSKKGIWELGTMSFPPEESGGAKEVSLSVPSGALSTGENILVLRPAEGTGDYDQLSLQRVHLEANELPEPPKIEGIDAQ